MEELLADSELKPVENKGDFSVPIKLTEALALYGVSRSKFFAAIKKAGIRSRRIKGVDFFPKLDLDRVFPTPIRYNRDEWYSVDEIMEKTGLTRKYIRDFVRKRGIGKIAVGQRILINKKEWDLERFSKGQLAEEFLTVDQAKKLYHIGQGRFYETVNAAGIERHRDGVSVYFRKSDLEKLFGCNVPSVPDDVIKNYICAKEALKTYHIGQKRFSEETTRFCVEKIRLKGFMWYRREDLDRVFGKTVSKGDDFIISEKEYYKYERVIDYYAGLNRSDRGLLALLLRRFNDYFSPLNEVQEEINRNLDNCFTYIQNNQSGFKPIVGNIELRRASESKGKQEDVIKRANKVFDEKLKSIADSYSSPNILYPELMIVMLCKAIRNLDSVEDVTLKTTAYTALIKKSLQYTFVLKDSLARYANSHDGKLQ